MENSVSQSYYTYMLRRPVTPDTSPEIVFPDNTVPFYVGKGCKKRIEQHEMCARRRENCRHMPCRVIRKVWREGGEIQKDKVLDNASEQEAFDLEKLLIAYGRSVNWPLINLSDGGDTGPTGCKRTPEQLEAQSARMKEYMLADPARRNRIGDMFRGRKMTQEESEVFHQKLKDLYASDPELIERQRQISQNYWAEHPAYFKTSFKSPSGIIHQAETIPNLSEFCRQNGLDRPNMIKLANGEIHSYKGWTRYPEVKAKQEYHGTYVGPALLSPEGIVYTPEDIDCLNAFCRERGLQAGSLSRVAQGKQRIHKGWTRL